MLYEKKKLIIRRAVCAGLLLLGIIIPIIIANVPPKEAEIIDDNGYINNYYEYSNTTDCEIEVTFNTDVDSGYVTVAFYDDRGKLLAKQEKYFSGTSDTLSSTVYIAGKVASYEIIDYDISASNGLLVAALILLPLGDMVIFIFLIASLFLSYKAYVYNGNEIIVYAGWYHNYIKVNGTKLDEHNAWVTFGTVRLSCTLNDGTDIKAAVTMTNRITLKINNQLYKNGDKL